MTVLVIQIHARAWPLWAKKEELLEGKGCGVGSLRKQNCVTLAKSLCNQPHPCLIALEGYCHRIKSQRLNLALTYNFGWVCYATPPTAQASCNAASSEASERGLLEEQDLLSFLMPFSPGFHIYCGGSGAWGGGGRGEGVL